MMISLLALLTTAQAGAVDDALTQAAALGIPTDSLEAKAREGAAKGLPEARVATALTRMAGELAETDAILGGSDHAGVLDAATAARAGGASDATLRRLADVDEPAIAELALWGVADLLSQGFSESQALDLVQTGLVASDPTRNLTGLATATSSMLASGASHSTVTGRISSSMSVGIAPLSSVSEGGGPPAHANNDKDKEKGNKAGGNGNGNANGHDK